MKLIYKIEQIKYDNVKEVLKCQFHLSDRLITKLKKEKRIFLNNKPVYVTEKLNFNDTIKVDIDFVETSDNIVPTKMDLNIIYEDDALLIINKPPFIPVHPSCNHYENSLSNGVKYYFNSINLQRKIRPVNRLDKDTSGLVLFAKNEYIQANLINQMQNKNFKKKYIAFLTGNLNDKFGTINAPIARKAGSIMERTIDESGEKAITHFEILENYNDFCKVKFILETGRTHQLRVHSKYIGHSILGDTLYGEKSNLINRQALHAYKITFIHPITQNNLSFTIDLPDDMKNLIN